MIVILARSIHKSSGTYMRYTAATATFVTAFLDCGDSSELLTDSLMEVVSTYSKNQLRVWVEIT